MTQTTTSAKTNGAAELAVPSGRREREAPSAAGAVTTRRTPQHLLRIALLTLAVVVVLAASFVVGRATADTTPGHGPAAVTPTASQTSAYICRVGRPC